MPATPYPARPRDSGMSRRAAIKTARPKPPFTVILYLLGIATIGVMLFFYATHVSIPEDAGWVQYTLYMTVFAASTLVGLQLLNQQPLIPTRPDNFAPLSLDTGVRASIILLAIMITQVVSKSILSFTIEEQATYFVFAAVAEELFFRGLLITFVLKIKDDRPAQVIAVVVQAVLFAAIHQNYYNNPAMLLSVFLGGIVLGIFFVAWRDLTANTLAHFMLNLIAVQNLLVML